MQALRSIVVALLTYEARLTLARYKPRVIAVTGSVGKTTTKDAIFSALSGELHVRKSAKSFNSEIGVPLTILGLDNAWSNPILWAWNLIMGAWLVLFPHEYPAWLVLEVGADRPGDIRSVARWLRPDIAVFTGVPEIPSHIEYFKSVEELLKEKRALAEYLKPGGKLILNGDDKNARSLRPDFRGATITYGLEAENDFLGTHEEIEYEGDVPVGIRLRIEHAGFSVPVSIRGALGKPRSYAVLAAVAVGTCVGVDPVSAARSLALWEPPPGRVRIIAGKNGSVLIDDTYNSSPAAALAALDILGEVKASRRIAILGDMLELGKFTNEAHRTVGAKAGESADQLITVGVHARSIAAAAREAGMAEDRVHEYEIDSAMMAVEKIAEDLKQGDVVLVKGSQGVRLERVVKALMSQPEDASKLLVRMDEEWQRR